MQQFLTDYGLWMLIGLLIVIALVFLISKSAKTPDMVDVAAIEPTPIVPPLPAMLVGEVPVLPIVEPMPVEPVASPEPQPQPQPQPQNSDDLLRLKGVGPKLNTLLVSLGVTRFEQIANWTDADIATIDTRLGTFKGRPVRDQWIDQAKYLAAGDIAGFEAKYGKL